MLKKLTDEQQRDILRSAILEFGECGYNKGSIIRIAKGAGVSVGVIYKYYANKEELFLACIHQATSDIESTLLADLKVEDDLETAARRIIRQSITVSKEHPEYIRMYNEITTDSDREWTRKVAAEIEAGTASVYKEVIERGQRSGEIPEDYDTNVFAFMFDNLMMMLHFAYSCDYYNERMKVYLGDESKDIDEILEEQLVLMLRRAINQ